MAASGRSETTRKLPVSIAQWIVEVEICMILDTYYYLNANFPNFSKAPQTQLINLTCSPSFPGSSYNSPMSQVTTHHHEFQPKRQTSPNLVFKPPTLPSHAHSSHSNSQRAKHRNPRPSPRPRRTRTRRRIPHPIRRRRRTRHIRRERDGVIQGIRANRALPRPFHLRARNSALSGRLLDRLRHSDRGSDSPVFGLGLSLHAGVRAVAGVDFVQPVCADVTGARSLNDGGGFGGAEVLGLGAGVGRCCCGEGDDFLCFGVQGGGHEDGGLGDFGPVEDGSGGGYHINAGAVGVFGGEGRDGTDCREGGDEECGAHGGGGGGFEMRVEVGWWD